MSRSKSVPCPNCACELLGALTIDQVKTLRASMTGALQTPHAGPGAPATCSCGICPKCKRRAYLRGWRAKRKV
jgi:hypothetical protein